MICVCGIDPGKDGAGVLLDGRLVLGSWLTKSLVPSKGYDADRLADAVRSLHAEHRIGLAVLELAAGRPGEGRGSARVIGEGFGLWRGILAALCIPTITPASSVWTRAVLRDMQGEGKERAVGLALTYGLDLTPGRRKRPHSGLADALALAVYGQGHPLAGVS